MTIKEINKVSNFLTKYLDKELPARLSFSIAKFCLSAEDNQKLFAEKNLLLAKNMEIKMKMGIILFHKIKFPNLQKNIMTLRILIFQK